MSQHLAPKSGFDVVRVLGTVVIVAVIGGGGYALFSYLTTDPGKLYEATGEVTWNGEPVTIGAVMTLHESDPYLSALGPLDENGHFTLLTNMEPGAAIGRHKLIVASYGDGMPPPPLVPAHYASYDDTPLYIDVTSDPQKNHFIIRLEGELQERRRPGPPDDAASEADDAPADETSTPDATDAGVSNDETTSESP